MLLSGDNAKVQKVYHEFFDRRNRTAGTLRPERLKASVRDKVLADSKTEGRWFAFERNRPITWRSRTSGNFGERHTRCPHAVLSIIGSHAA